MARWTPQGRPSPSSASAPTAGPGSPSRAARPSAAAEVRARRPAAARRWWPGTPRPSRGPGRRRCCPRCPGCSRSCAGRRVCVLASGDPMFHGIGATLARVLGPERLRVLPHPSSVSLACARLGWPLDGGRGGQRGRPSARPGPAGARTRGPACWCSARTRDTPAALAALLDRRRLRRLGDDRARRSSAARPSAASTAPRARLGAPAGRPAERRRRRVRRGPGAPVRGEVPGPARRRLRPRRPAHQARGPRRHARPARARGPASCCGTSARATGRSGSSGCAPTATCRAVAVEPDPARAARIAANADALGVPDLRVVRGPGPRGAGRAADAGRGVHRRRHHAPGVLDACWAALRAGRAAGRERRHRWRPRRCSSPAAPGSAASSPGSRWRGRHRVGGFTGWRPAMPVTIWSARPKDAT